MNGSSVFDCSLEASWSAGRRFAVRNGWDAVVRAGVLWSNGCSFQFQRANRFRGPVDWTTRTDRICGLKLGIGHGFVQHFGAPEWRILVGVELFGHTAATLALGAGVPAKVVSEQLGHASVAFTLDTYSHVLPHMQEAAAAQMEALLFEAAPKKRAARKTKRTTTHRSKREHKMKASSK